MSTAEPQSPDKGGPLDRFLRIFSDVRTGEGVNAILMLLTVFLLLVSYYVIKVVREPLILAVPDGARLKSYSAAGQAVVLLGFVPFYSWFASRVDRRRLIVSVSLFFILCVELFVFAVAADVPYIGVVFYIWCGVFSLSTIAQFWSLANDVYAKDSGARLFPIIGVGATLGSPVGSAVAKALFDANISIPIILQIAGLLLLAHGALLFLMLQRFGASASAAKKKEPETLSSESGFSLVFKSRYIMLMAALFLLLNIVNTVGEYVVSAEVSTALAEAIKEAGISDVAEVKAFSKKYFGSFYGSYFLYANILAVLVQALLVSRIVKYAGLRGVVLLLPLVSLTTYGLIATVGGLAVVRWAKTLENVTDYSVMNTGRAMLWLPTTREEKYKAKQAIDTFFVRFGDVAAACVVYAGSEWFKFSSTAFSVVNVCVAAVWIGVALLLLKQHARVAG